MFTGIIEEIGIVQSVHRDQDIVRILIQSSKIVRECHAGDSIAVNGICLTVTVQPDSKLLSFDAVPETASRTRILHWKAGTRVNLEQAVTPQTHMGGHFVQGHVDTIARIMRITTTANGREFWFQVDEESMRFIVPKGSIAIDGVSLTIAEVRGNTFRVALIPFTLEHTIFNTYTVGSEVNIETDILGRYVEQFLMRGTNVSLLEKLQKSGFTARNI